MDMWMWSGETVVAVDDDRRTSGSGGAGRGGWLGVTLRNRMAGNNG